MSKLFRWIAALVLAAAAMPAAAQVSYVRAGKLVDVLSGRVLSDQIVKIEGERIVSVGPWSAAPTDGPVTDWSAYTVLPGLIDMHTHIADFESTSNPAEPLMHSQAEAALIGAKNARTTLRAGFTSVHDVGAYRGLTDVALRDAINAGWVPGPRMNVVGGYITVPGGGGDITGQALDVAVPPDMRLGVVRGAEDVRDKVRSLFQRRVDSIKIIASGAVLAIGSEPNRLELSQEEIRAAVAEARANGGWVSAHAHGAEPIKVAIREGVRTIEHASLIDAEGIALAKARGTFLVMDIYNGTWFEEVGTKQGWPAEYLRKGRETTDAQRAGFTAAVKAGVKIAFGTDAGVYPHGDNARQFAYMVRYGMTPMQAIQSATSVAAEALRWEKDVGAIAAGRFADMVAVRGDPVADIAVLEKPAAVMKSGALVP